MNDYGRECSADLLDFWEWELASADADETVEEIKSEDEVADLVIDALWMKRLGGGIERKQGLEL